MSIIALICLSGVGWTLTGCADGSPKPQNDYLIKVGNEIMTVTDFKKAFELSKAAYPYDILQNPEAVREAMLRLVRQMTEEMILLERAKETHVTVTAPEMDQAIANIKKDYPNQEFQNSLVENAVPYPSWEQALKRRLIMEKVIAKDLGDQIQVTPDDISAYEKTHPAESGGAPDAEKEAASKPAGEKIVEKTGRDAVEKILRREKLEKAYPSWVEALRNKYTVKINEKQLQKLTDLQQIRKHLAS